jgi:hypothetical protein
MQVKTCNNELQHLKITLFFTYLSVNNGYLMGSFLSAVGVA